MGGIEIPWDADDGNLKPGVYLAKIRECTYKFAKTSGTPMLSLVLDASDFGRKLCHDNIMLGGGGWGIGKGKLKCLGYDESMKELDPVDLIGKYVFVAVKEREYNGQKQLEVDIKQGKAGYWAENDPPQGVLSPNEPAPSKDDVPF